MRTIERSSAFKRDNKREAGTAQRSMPIWCPFLWPWQTTTLWSHGDWQGYRECHIKPDLLLIYKKSDAATLRLARLGSHSELFG
jgi:mRNA interferase YafQ